MTLWYAVMKLVHIPCNVYQQHTVLYAFPDSGLDYTGGLLTAVFKGSSTAVVPVPTLTNSIVEGEENFTAVIVVPLDATMACRVRSGTPARATVVINDDDSK